MFKLETSPEGRLNDAHRVLQDLLAFLGWEVCHGQTLPILPDVLSASVADYDLIVVFVPSVAVWQRHATHLRTLSPDFSFLIVLDGVFQSSLKSQCPTLSLGMDAPGGMVLPLLLTLCDAAKSSSASCDARSLAAIQTYATFVVVQRQGTVTTGQPPSAVDVPWCADDIRSDVTYSLLLSVDTDDEEVDGRYVGGLLKHIVSTARIKLSEKRGHVAIRTREISQTAELESLVSGTRLAHVRFTLTQPGTFVSDPIEGDAAAVCGEIRGAKAVQSRIDSCFPTFRLEVTSSFPVFLALSMLVDRSTIDNEICCRVEHISFPTFRGPVSLTSAMNSSTASSIAVGATTRGWPDSAVGEMREASKDVGRPPLGNASPSRESAPPPLVPNTAAASPPIGHLSEVDIQRLIDQKVSAALVSHENANREWRTQMESNFSEAIRRWNLSEERNHSLESSFSHLHSFVEEKLSQFGELADKSSLEDQLKQLAKQVDLIRESAADHRLVESALNDVRSRSATLEGVREAEQRVASIAQSVQRSHDQVRHGTESLKGHMEALTIQHQQLAHRIESVRSGSEVQQVLETSLRRLDSRLGAVENAQQKMENDSSLFQKAFEVGLNRLFEQLRFFHDDMNKLDGVVNSQTSRIDQLQSQLAATESTVRRMVDEAIASGSEYRMQAVQDQLTSVKAYCVAAVERSSEMQSDNISEVEKKLARDMQRAMDILQQQHQSEVQRIQNSVEGHIKSQKQLMDELQMMSPARLAGSPRKEDMTLLREQVEHAVGEQNKLRERLKAIELLHADVSAFIGNEEKRRAETDELTLRIEELEASIQFIEARL